MSAVSSLVGVQHYSGFVIMRSHDGDGSCPDRLAGGAMLHRAVRTRLAAVFVVVLLSGCASQSYDPTPPRDAPLRALRFESALSQEDSYRTLHARLVQCLRTSGYHVQPRFERDTGRAWIMVVQGLGLDRYSFLGNRFAARFDVREAGSGSVIDATVSVPELEALAHSARDWLVTGARGC